MNYDELIVFIRLDVCTLDRKTILVACQSLELFTCRKANGVRIVVLRVQCYFTGDVYMAAITDISQLPICLHRGGIGKYHGCGETKYLAASLGKSERARR